MKTIAPTSLARLAALLREPAPDPAAAATALASLREELAGDDPIAQELIAGELRWLAGQATRDGELGRELPRLERDWLALRIRSASEAPPDAAVAFDLAEAEAAATFAGTSELLQQARTALAHVLPQIAAGPPAAATIEHEVGERFALLTTAIDDLPIGHQVQLLRSTGRVAGQLGKQCDSARCRSLGRRLLRAGDDRELAQRMEGLLGARGVSLLETTNFVLLLVVLTTLLLEATVALTPGQWLLLQWIDALACLFFIADFAFELALHPSRGSWFVRNAVTDLLPAIPSVLFLVPTIDVPAAAGNAPLLRVLRLLRVTWAARYVQALRPLLRSFRLFLFLVRGLDGLAARFAQILNRDFVFDPGARVVKQRSERQDLRDLLFAAMRREHELLALLPTAERGPACRARAQALATRLSSLPPGLPVARAAPTGSRELALGDAIRFLWTLRPQDVGRWLRAADVQALDRVIRVLSAAPVRWLPIIRRFAVYPLPKVPEERVVALGRRIAAQAEGWHERMLFWADLHGIVTGPQILDRFASALVKATQRPAVRLLLFGGLFSVLRLFWVDNPLSKVVGLPLVLLGGVCLVLLTLGHWLRRLAGQASEAFRLTSEACFLSQLEQQKRRYESDDLAFLAARVFGDGAAGEHCRRALAAQVGSVRTGVPAADAKTPALVRLEANRIALLYLHYLDGAPLHDSDVQTTEQLLANPSLDSLRRHFLRHGAAEQKRLRKLRLDEGTVFSGPYLWFSFITESIAVEAAKRVAGYNRYCVPLDESASAPPAAMAAMHDWLLRRRDPRGGRTGKESVEKASMLTYPTTEFTALDFVAGEPERDQHLASLFGDDVLAVVRADRRTMVREIFGTRPVAELAASERSFNPLRFHRRYLSHGRVLLLPLLLAWRLVRALGRVFKLVRRIVREVLDPELAMQQRTVGEATFAVALRKIHRMKAPGLLEATWLRLRLDPVYAGAPAGWSTGLPFAAEPELARDLRFLQLGERQAEPLREAAAAVLQQVEALHAALRWLPSLGVAADAEAAAAAELAVTCAWIADQGDVRTLLFAERWRAENWPQLTAAGPGSRFARILTWLRCLVWTHPVDRWLRPHGPGVNRRERACLLRAWRADHEGVRATLTAWSKLPAGSSPAEAAIATLRAAFAHGPAVQRDLCALRAVQSLAILDVRNYRDLVYCLGDYAREGEQHAIGALP
jgi:hypothetical protein